MIDSISVPLEEFDFVRFFAAIEEFCCCCAPDEERDHRFIHALKQHGDIPLPPPEGQNVIKALLKGELMLFFPMHQPLVATGALAVDGRRRPFRSFGIRCRDAYGWLVEVHDGMVSLHPRSWTAPRRDFPDSISRPAAAPWTSAWIVSFDSLCWSRNKTFKAEVRYLRPNIPMVLLAFEHSRQSSTWGERCLR